MTTLKPKRVLLIGWDAADWQMIQPLMDSGQMPNMKRFVDEGVSGNVATLQPPLSPMLWTSVVTGKHADKHGVLGFAEVDDATGKVRPVTSTGRTCKAIWNILSDHNRPSGIINWYASHPAEPVQGFVVTDRFAHPTGTLKENEPKLGWETIPNSVWPTEDLDDLSKVRVHPQMISLEQVMAFVPGADKPESASWEKIRELRMLLAHCATVHNSATAFMEARDWDFMGIYYDAIDRFAHAFMEFHPPQMDHVSDADFALYQGVMNECYRFHDLMLGRVMNLVDDDTAVVVLSDHGFHCGSTRPAGSSGIVDGQPAAWHRPYGIIAFWGPGMKKGGKLYGATLLDITPTLLTMFDMPPARDMDGLPLTQIWEEPRLCVERVDTYETGTHHSPNLIDTQPAESVEDVENVDDQIMHQLRQLGYLSNDEADSIIVDRARNLGTVYMSTGRAREALEQFEKVQCTKPDTPGIQLSIGACYLALGQLNNAKAIAQSAAENQPKSARVHILLAMISTQQREHEHALDHLKSAHELDASIPGLITRIGDTYSLLNQWDQAEASYTQALDRDPDDAEALDGIGVVYQRTNRPHEAVLAHTQSIALVRNRAATHLHIGEALISIDRTGWAIESFVEAARIAPWDAAPHARLADIYKQLIGNQAKADFHRKRALQIRAAQRAKRETILKTSPPLDVARTSKDQPQSNGLITVVSGLPRSGTSLMMQMLEAGGMPILCDQVRQPDENNPRGYLELEAVKHTASDSTWLEEAPNHAVKAIHALLHLLPPTHEYAVIFMKRDLDEVVASQSSMLQRMGREGTTLTSEALLAAYAREYERIGGWLALQPNFRVLEVSYNQLIDTPGQVIQSLQEFIHMELDTHQMCSMIDPSLYRERNE